MSDGDGGEGDDGDEGWLPGWWGEQAGIEG